MATLASAEWLVEVGAAKSLAAAYRMMRQVLPPGVVVALGPKKVRVSTEAFERWVAAGGTQQKLADPLPEGQDVAEVRHE
jgi:hypothetical protein